jgi:Cu+-exporting ATPase
MKGDEDMERDPVCGMQLAPGQEEANLNFQGRTYHFCSAECRRLFESNPKEYIDASLMSDRA